MIGYTFEVGCTHCEAPLAHKAPGAVYTHRTNALAACTRCGSEFVLDLTLRMVRGPVLRDPIRHSSDHNRNPDAPGAALINALMAASR
jgi:hypothetical protein